MAMIGAPPKPPPPRPPPPAAGIKPVTRASEFERPRCWSRISSLLKRSVERRARKAVSLGIDGIVASPLEAAALRQSLGPKPILVTPGVRSAGAAWEIGRASCRERVEISVVAG